MANSFQFTRPTRLTLAHRMKHRSNADPGSVFNRCSMRVEPCSKTNRARSVPIQESLYFLLILGTHSTYITTSLMKQARSIDGTVGDRQILLQGGLARGPRGGLMTMALNTLCVDSLRRRFR